ncbi:BolA family transcriptional regulator [Methylobacillus arboreus]|uniref:BolA family protein n=1 Tax=Methylobacillus arboreus TaxID=755170 RepID=UPI001E41EA84|nr:BolA family protein [Methylobacillus arboreus]MCB5189385.1 BolA family transcriptional regulator [Methylobacillus arboreus]
MTLIEEIRNRLSVLEPAQLDIRDDSALHRGHAGNNGGGHFFLAITSATFCGKSHIMRHRQVYAALGDLIPGRIHALSIQAFATDEPRPVTIA